MKSPRVVLGMPAYNRPDTLPRALETLLSQTFDDLVIVITDDCPTAEVKAVVDAYAAIDPRVVYEPNPVRLGMIGNWRKAFNYSRDRFPGLEYFAWVSDHDIWHPRWLEVLVAVLDEHPQVVLTYPQMERVYRTQRRAVIRQFDTLGLTTPLRRLRATFRGLTAGNCVYGLFRVEALTRAGVFRPVLAPDRQIVVQLLLLGETIHVDETLWFREVAGMFSYRRQRRMFFPDHVPLHTYLPVGVQHFGVMFWDFAVRGRGRPAFGRVAGAFYACVNLSFSLGREAVRVRRAVVTYARARGWVGARAGADGTATTDGMPPLD